jgi:8-oxo-dGTP diphosphatase
MEKRIIGIGVFIFKEGKILLGHQYKSYEQPCWSAPGGKLDPFETLEEAAKREVLEETGLEISNLQFVKIYEDIYQGHHVISIQAKADWVSGEPMITEPAKCDKWDWFDPALLPAPLSEIMERAVLDQVI